MLLYTCIMQNGEIKTLKDKKKEYKCVPMKLFSNFKSLQTVLVLIKLTKGPVALRLCVTVPVNLLFDIISSFFAKFKNAVHRLEPCETPSNSASHQALSCVQRS